MARQAYSKTTLLLGTALLASAAILAPPVLAQDSTAPDAPPQAVSPAATPTRGAEYPAGDPQNPAPAPVGPFAGWWAWKADLKQKGVDFTLAYRSEDLAEVSGGGSGSPVHAGQIALTSQYDMNKLVGWDGASITASFAYRDGGNINQKSDVDALLGPQEIFGRGHYFRMTQLWLDQALFDHKLELRLGRLSPGEEFEATECSFTNLSFCANQPGNFVSDVWYTWPISQWGTAAKLNFGHATYFKLGAYQTNPRNLRGDFLAVLSPKGGTGALIPFEFGWMPTFADGRIGEYRIGGWYSTASRKDLYEDVNGNPAAVTGLPFREHPGSYGAFVSLVQQITRGDAKSAKSGLRGVFKASVADHATSLVDRTIVGTLVYTGTFAGRSADDVGLALGFNHLNDRASDYRAELQAEGLPGALPGSTERTVEAYYSLRFGSTFMFRPDAQWIHNPGGSGRRQDVAILGMRTEISF